MLASIYRSVLKQNHRYMFQALPDYKKIVVSVANDTIGNTRTTLSLKDN